MKANASGQNFKYFMRHAFVLRHVTDALDCNDTCHADIICALTYITKENFEDCLIEMGIKKNTMPTLPTPIKMPTTTTTTTVITKINLLTTKANGNNNKKHNNNNKANCMDTTSRVGYYKFKN